MKTREIGLSAPYLGEREEELVLEVLRSGSLSLGPTLDRFEERSSSARGRQVRVEEKGGFEGMTEGLDPRGFLQVRTRQGLRTVYSGTVRFK